MRCTRLETVGVLTPSRWASVRNERRALARNSARILWSNSVKVPDLGRVRAIAAFTPENVKVLTVRAVAWFMRRLRLALAAPIAIMAVIPGVLGQGMPSGIHSPNVADVEHSPEGPERGQDVEIVLEVQPDAALEAVILTYCRAENYACAPSQEMEPDGADRFRGKIVWHGPFFADARNVGYKFTLRFENDSDEQSPLQHWPSRPPVLPEGAGIYYWYALPPPTGGAAPGLNSAGLFFAIAVALLVGTSRTRTLPRV